MDPQHIKTWIDVMSASDLSELEFSQDGWTLRLRRNRGPSTALATPAAATAPAPVAADLPPPSTAAPSLPAAIPRVSTLSAPLYGVVHLSPSPSEPAFVRVGEPVQAGQALCVIEAMKVFNEVRAEQAGVLQAILVSSGQEVEGGQALFRFA